MRWAKSMSCFVRSNQNQNFPVQTVQLGSGRREANVLIVDSTGQPGKYESLAVSQCRKGCGEECNLVQCIS